MNIKKTEFDGLLVLERDIFEDNRGQFSKLFSLEDLQSKGYNFTVKQINKSINKTKGTIRGIHYQISPSQENKIIICNKGSLFDVAVDLRKNSKTFLQHYTIQLSEKNNSCLLIPQGFAHGFQTLEDNTEIMYIHSEDYLLDLERGLNYNEPKLNIEWPLQVSQISEKDKNRNFINEPFEGI